LSYSFSSGVQDRQVAPFMTLQRIHTSTQNLSPLFFDLHTRPALGPTQPHVQWVLGAHSPAVKLSRREADHLAPSNAEV
jgi:hypothetical protein